MDNPITPLTAGVVGFVRRLFGPAASEVGEVLADRVRSYRAANLHRILESTAIKIGSRSIEELPLRFSIPFFEKASLEDDEKLAEMWSGLLVESAEGVSSKHHIILQVFSNLTPRAATLLSSLIGDYYKNDDCYEGLNWDEEFTRDLTDMIKSKLSGRLRKWQNQDQGRRIAEKIFTFDHHMPFNAFYVRLPAIQADKEEEYLRIKNTSNSYGHIYMPFSVESHEINLLEREQLVRRVSFEFDVSYAKVAVTYIAATSLAIDLIETCTHKAAPEDDRLCQNSKRANRTKRTSTTPET